MKRIITIILSAVLSASAFSQTVSDAVTFGQNDFIGTARSLALGNAVTAVGGDLGTIAVNPAGSAVARYSQFVFSPGWITSESASRFSSTGDEYGPSANSSFKRFYLPNIGLTARFESEYEDDPVRSVTFAFVSNATQTFSNTIEAGGTNRFTSINGYFADQARYNPDARDPHLAYETYLINPDGLGGYYAVTQNPLKESAGTYALAGQLNQKYAVKSYGTKHDIAMNMGVNLHDNLFIGFTISVPIFEYHTSEFFGETPVDPDMFPAKIDGINGNFLGSSYTYAYDSNASGISLGIGAIYVPVRGVRLGASFLSPTLFEVNEQWYSSMTHSHSRTSSSLSSNTLENSYNFVSPLVLNLGAAFTIGQRLLLSADYSLTDYGSMSFSPISEDYYYEDYYEFHNYLNGVNRLTKLFCGASHALRAGAEFRMSPHFSIRGGVGGVSSPKRIYTDDEGYTVDADMYDRYFDEYESGQYRLITKSVDGGPAVSWSFGLGYSSDDSFYADFAWRTTNLTESYYSPYGTYYTTDGGKTYIPSPVVRSLRSLKDMVITFGWRF